MCSAIRLMRQINRDIRNNQKNTMNLLDEPHNVLIEADKGRLTQVIYNLLNNAVKFIKGCDGWTITIEVEKKDNEIIGILKKLSISGTQHILRGSFQTMIISIRIMILW
jgi:signal transduction histidine kinase